MKRYQFLPAYLLPAAFAVAALLLTVRQTAEPQDYLTGMGVVLAFWAAASLWSWRTGAQAGSGIAAVTILLTAGCTYQSLFGNCRAYAIFALLSCAAMAGCYLLFRDCVVPDWAFAGILAAVAGLLLLNVAFGRGEASSGARLWIFVGSVGFQPGEAVKVGLVILGAAAYQDRRRSALYCVAALVSCVTLLLLRDLGNAAVIFAVFVVMTYLLFDSRAVSLGLIGGAVVLFAVMVAKLPYAAARIRNLGHAMTQEYSAQQAQIIKAVLLGGLGGLGFDYAGIVTRIFAAETDSALAGLWAVFGLGALLAVVLAYLVLVLLPAWNRSVFPFCHLVLVQLSVTVFVQVFLNLGGSLDVLPFTGVVAPLVSQGGSAMVCFGGLLGLAAAALHPRLQKKGRC